MILSHLSIRRVKRRFPLYLVDEITRSPRPSWNCLPFHPESAVAVVTLIGLYLSSKMSWSSWQLGKGTENFVTTQGHFSGCRPGVLSETWGRGREVLRICCNQCISLKCHSVNHKLLKQRHLKCVNTLLKRQKCVRETVRIIERGKKLSSVLLSEGEIMPLATQMISPLLLSQVFNSAPKGMWLIVRWVETRGLPFTIPPLPHTFPLHRFNKRSRMSSDKEFQREDVLVLGIYT